jgi:hypothetical protein
MFQLLFLDRAKFNLTYYPSMIYVNSAYNLYVGLDHIQNIYGYNVN